MTQGDSPHTPLEEALVFWLLSVFLHCLGQQSRLPEGVSALVCLTKALVPALVPRLSVLCRAQHGGASEPFLPEKLPQQVAAARYCWGTAKSPASLCYVQNRMKPGTRRG